MTGFEHASAATLAVLRRNLLAGLDNVAASLADGTFYALRPKGSAPPAQSGHLTLALLKGVTAELKNREEAGRMSRALTVEQANAVWDVLVEHAGTSEDGREDFVLHATSGNLTEYRFQGSLGFGGKFWLGHDSWYVTAYPEDTTPERQQVIDVTNAALAGLHASFVARDAALGGSDGR